VLFFSDAVVAIAITLLILPVLDLVSETHSVTRLFHDDGRRVEMFLISFAVIAQFWVSHHRMFERLVTYSYGLVWANMLWLATIAFLPFPTEVLGQFGDEDARVRFLYIGSVLAGSAALLVLEVVIARVPELRRHPDQPSTGVWSGVAMVGSLVLALVLGTAVSAISLWSLLLLVPAGMIGARLDRSGAGRVSRVRDPDAV
jgi:uncharacterized membrane protein